MPEDWMERLSFSVDDPAKSAHLEQQRALALDAIRNSQSFLILTREGVGIRICQAIHPDDALILLAGLNRYLEASGSLVDIVEQQNEEAA